MIARWLTRHPRIDNRISELFVALVERVLASDNRRM